MNTSETVVASIGLASLAVSLGAQGLVADVLAGLSIVFAASCVMHISRRRR